MFKNQEKTNSIGISNSKMQGMKFPQKKIKAKDLGNISLDLSKEEEIMKNTPGLMENSMIENITAMNSIFEQKQSERLMLTNLNKLNNNKNDFQSNSINNSNQTFNALVNSDISGSKMKGESPLDIGVIIKDSSEVIKEEKQKENKKKKTKKNKKKKKKKVFNKMTIFIIILLSIILLLIIGLIYTYISVTKDR